MRLSKRTETVTKVNAKGDTIVSRRDKSTVNAHSYAGSFWTLSGATTGRRVLTPAGYVDLTTGHRYWYLTNRQGSTMAVVDETGAVVQRNGYYPSGTPFVLPSEVGSTEAPSMTAVADQLHIGNRWLGHSGLAMYDNTARLHDPLLMRYASPDPLFGKYPDTSPWTHCAANPLNAIDPDGLRPIYDLNGNFMGTDESGFDGDFIVMDANNFEQNMLPEVADRYAVPTWTLSPTIQAKIGLHYKFCLPARPDYDGFITWSEAVDWGKNGPDLNTRQKKSLFVDINKLDFSGAVVSGNNINFTDYSTVIKLLSQYLSFWTPNYIGIGRLISDLNNGANKILQQAAVLGNVTSIQNEDGTISLKPDVFNFERHEGNSVKTKFRNALTLAGKIISGDITGEIKSFKIEFYGKHR